MKKISKRNFLFSAGSFLSLTSHFALAKDVYPNKPIKFILPFSPGGGTDKNSRALAEELQKIFNIPVICENKPGASGAIAVRSVTSAPADGYTVLVATNSLVSVNPVTNKDLGYDPFKDLSPVHGLVVAAPVVCGPIDSPYKGIKEALIHAKSSNKPLRIGNYSKGYELLATWLGHLEDAPIIHVSYKGPSQMLMDLIGGQIDFSIGDPSSAMELINAKKIRGFAIGADKREANLPDLPTMKELGYAEYESYVWASVFVKAGTPLDIRKKLAQSIALANSTPTMVSQRKGRPERSLDLSLEELGKFQREEYERFKKVAELTSFNPS